MFLQILVVERHNTLRRAVLRREAQPRLLEARRTTVLQLMHRLRDRTQARQVRLTGPLRVQLQLTVRQVITVSLLDQHLRRALQRTLRHLEAHRREQPHRLTVLLLVQPLQARDLDAKDDVEYFFLQDAYSGDEGFVFLRVTAKCEFCCCTE